MNCTKLKLATRAGMALLATAALLVSGCVRKDDHATFDSAEASVAALAQALGKDDTVALQRLLGPGSEELLSSGDVVQDKSDRAAFLAAFNEKHSLVADGTDAFTLVTGAGDWPFPVPVVRKDGRWKFDGSKGADELVYRRVGANELGAIAVSRGFVAAQVDYAAAGRDGDAAGIYALKLISDRGTAQRPVLADRAGRACKSGRAVRCRSGRRRLSQRRTHTLSRVLLPHAVSPGRQRQWRIA